MLYIFISTLLLIPAFIGIGNWCERCFKRSNNSLAIKALLGMNATAFVWALVAFFYPINLYSEAVFLALGFSGFFLMKSHREMFSFLRQHSFYFGISLVICLLAGSFYPFILDHFGYYIPTINWIKTFGLTKGISNLDIVLGQMSVWHILQAGLSSFSDIFLRLNTITLVIYLIYIFERSAWAHWIFVPFLFLFAQSPSPDLPTLIISLIILNEVFRHNTNASLLWSLSAFVFVIKPTMIWVPIFIALYLIFTVKASAKHYIMGSIFILLFVLKNIWCFGYPIFPVQVLDLNLSWKPDLETLKISSEIAIQKTYDMQYSMEEIRQFSTWDYIINWITLKGIKAFIHIAFILSILILGIITAIRKSSILYFLFFAVVVKSLLVLLFSAQYRFFLDVFFVVALVLLLHRCSKTMGISLFVAFSIFFIGFLAQPLWVQTYVPSFQLGHYMKGFNIKQLVKPSHYALKRYSTHQVGNLKFNVAQGYPFSFDTPMPAITFFALKEYSETKVFPQKIGESPKEGFIWKKLNDEEQKQLQDIIKQVQSNSTKSE